LSQFARNLVAITLRVPSWVFGAHLPDNIKLANESQLALPVESVAGATSDISKGVVPASGALPDNTSAASPVDGSGGPSGAGVAANTAGKLALGAGTAMAAADGLHKSRKKKLSDAAVDGAQPLQDKPTRKRCVWNRGQEFHARAQTNVNLKNHLDAGAHMRDVCLARGLRVNKSTEPSYYRFDGRCHETSACPVTFLGRVYFGDVCEIEIKIFNGPLDHTGHDIAFASPFTAQELLVAQRYRDSCVTRPLTFAGLRAALEQSDSKDILSSSGFEKQLRNYVQRENGKRGRVTGDLPRRQRQPVVAELDCNVDRFRVKSLRKILQHEYHDTLCVLPGVVLNEVRGFVPFTCRGMLAALQTMKH